MTKSQNAVYPVNIPSIPTIMGSKFIRGAHNEFLKWYNFINYTEGFRSYAKSPI